MIRILREFDNVVVQGGHWDGITFHKNHAASASLVELGGDTHLFMRGVASGHVSKVGHHTIATNKRAIFSGHNWDSRYRTENPVMSPGDQIIPGDPTCVQDAYSMNAPCSTVRNESGTPTIVIYYNAKNSKNSNHLARATSEDGVHFIKENDIQNTTSGEGPIMPFVNAAVCTVNNVTYMTGSRVVDDNGRDRFAPMLYSSSNGKDFQKININLTFGPEGTWDHYSMQPTRLFYNAPYLYMVYCGSDTYSDYPEGVGIARAQLNNLGTWEKYNSNPIMIRGSGGMYDEGGMWAPAFYVANGRIHVFYEGFGGGSCIPGDTNSRMVRWMEGIAADKKLNGYGGIYVDGSETEHPEFSYSSVLHGILNVNETNLNDEWSNQQISGDIQIKDPITGNYLMLSSTTGGLATLTSTATTLNLVRARPGTGTSSTDNNDALMYIKSGTKMLGINRTESTDDAKDDVLLETLVTPTDLPDRKGEFLFYQVSEHIYQIQNRYSGLYLCPKTINGTTYVGQGLDNGTNQTFWQIEPAPTN